MGKVDHSIDVPLYNVLSPQCTGSCRSLTVTISCCGRVCCPHCRTRHTQFLSLAIQTVQRRALEELSLEVCQYRRHSLWWKEHSIACYREATKTGQALGIEAGLELNISAIALLVDQPTHISRRRFVYIGIETNCVVSIPSSLAYTATINHATSSICYKTEMQENKNYQVE